MAKEFLVAYGVDVDAVAGQIGSYAGGDSPCDISRGLFAGISLKGSSLREDKNWNRDLYHKEVSNKDIITKGVAAPAAAKEAAPATAPAAAPAAAVPAHNPTTAPVNVPHASPSVRKFARELGVPLEEIKGTGAKGRITESDVQGFVKAVMAGTAQTAAQKAAAPAGGAGGGAFPGLLPWPKVDFAKFGPIESKPLSRIKKLSGANLARNWVVIPHVTNNDEADITDLEAFRVALNQEQAKSGLKITMLAFLIKACVAALKKNQKKCVYKNKYKFLNHHIYFKIFLWRKEKLI